VLFSSETLKQPHGGGVVAAVAAEERAVERRCIYRLIRRHRRTRRVSSAARVQLTTGGADVAGGRLAGVRGGVPVDGEVCSG